MALLSETARVFVDTILTNPIPNLPTVQVTGNLESYNKIRYFLRIEGFLCQFGGESYKITGTVQNNFSNPVARIVLALERSSGVILDKALSDSVTGSFTLNVPNEDIVVVCIPEVADGVNAEIFDRITPVASI